MTAGNDESQLIPCPFCGRMTSEAANFCYYCARELKARPEHPAEGPKSKGINWIYVGIAIAIIAAVVMILLIFG